MYRVQCFHTRSVCLCIGPMCEFAGNSRLCSVAFGFWRGGKSNDQNVSVGEYKDLRSTLDCDSKILEKSAVAGTRSVACDGLPENVVVAW